MSILLTAKNRRCARRRMRAGLSSRSRRSMAASSLQDRRRGQGGGGCLRARGCERAGRHAAENNRTASSKGFIAPGLKLGVVQHMHHCVHALQQPVHLWQDDEIEAGEKQASGHRGAGLDGSKQRHTACNASCGSAVPCLSPCAAAPPAHPRWALQSAGAGGAVNQGGGPWRATPWRGLQPFCQTSANMEGSDLASHAPPLPSSPGVSSTHSRPPSSGQLLRAVNDTCTSSGASRASRLPLLPLPLLLPDSRAAAFSSRRCSRMADAPSTETRLPSAAAYDRRGGAPAAAAAECSRATMRLVSGTLLEGSSCSDSSALISVDLPASSPGESAGRIELGFSAAGGSLAALLTPGAISNLTSRAL